MALRPLCVDWGPRRISTCSRSHVGRNVVLTRPKSVMRSPSTLVLIVGVEGPLASTPRSSMPRITKPTPRELVETPAVRSATDRRLVSLRASSSSPVITKTLLCVS